MAPQRVQWVAWSPAHHQPEGPPVLCLHEQAHVRTEDLPRSPPPFVLSFSWSVRGSVFKRLQCSVVRVLLLTLARLVAELAVLWFLIEWQ